MLLQLAQQGVGFPHVGSLQGGRMAHLIECSRPYGFDFLPEFPRDGFGLLFERPPRSFDFAFELRPHCASPVQFGMRPSMRPSTAFFGR